MSDLNSEVLPDWGRISSLLKQKTLLSEFKKQNLVFFLFRARRRKRPTPCCGSSSVFKEAAGVSRGARSVSGPVLVRTAPAHPAPSTPNFHTPSGSPSLTADPANHSTSAAKRVSANLGYDLSEARSDWLVSAPAANDAPRGPPRPPMQRRGEAMRGSGSKWSYV